MWVLLRFSGIALTVTRLKVPGCRIDHPHHVSTFEYVRTWWATKPDAAPRHSAVPYILRFPGFKTRAVHEISSSRAPRRNAVFRSDVTQRSAVPRSVIIASHIATSAAAISTTPLIRPSGRSNERMKGTRTVHSPGADAFAVNPYGLINGAAANQSFSSSIDAARVSIDRPIRLPSRIATFQSSPQSVL